MGITIKKSALKFAAEPAEPAEGLYGESELQDDVYAVVAAQEAIAARKPPPEVEVIMKTIAEKNAADQKKIDDATKRIMAHLVTPDLAPEKPLKRMVGDRTIEISKRSLERKVVDIRRARQFMGDDTFFAAVNLPLKAVDDYLTLPQRNEVLHIGFKDDRKLKVLSLIKTVL